MTIKLFEGPAGTGKTTRLFSATAEHIGKNPLQPDQRVLALTKMHGSRRRMLEKFSEAKLDRSATECATLNSFVLGLVNRWRTLALTLADPLPADSDFAGLAKVATGLLQRDSVVNWVASRFPLLLVDELQDLRGEELKVVQELSRGLDILCAADEFQDLSAQTTCEGVEWAQNQGRVVALSHVHRTGVAALLNAAQAVRAGTPLTDGGAFRMFQAPTAAVAAGFMARNLTWAGSSQVVLLSPAGHSSSPFVRDAFARLALKPFKKAGKTFGPFTVPWEASAADETRDYADLLSLDDHDSRVVTATEIESHAGQLPGPFVDWVRTRGRLTGQTEFPAGRIREELARAQSLLRAFGSSSRASRMGMTIHQAKNREFDRVVILWPVTVGGGAEVQRRLLYNAITRAKESCVVIVQDPKPKASRMAMAPFA